MKKCQITITILNKTPAEIIFQCYYVSQNTDISSKTSVICQVYYKQVLALFDIVNQFSRRKTLLLLQSVECRKPPYCHKQELFGQLNLSVC